MKIKKYKCIVIRKDEYIIELDPNGIEDNLEKCAEYLALFNIKFGDKLGGFIPGYGFVKRNGEFPPNSKDLKLQGITGNPYINIIIESENVNLKVESKEIQ